MVRGLPNSVSPSSWCGFGARILGSGGVLPVGKTATSIWT